jgi:hypothetical protein
LQPAAQICRLHGFIAVVSSIPQIRRLLMPVKDFGGGWRMIVFFLDLAAQTTIFC